MSEPPRVDDFIRLFTGHEARMRAFAISLIPDWADAEDVLQQASIVMWKKFGEFALGSNFLAWAGRIIYLEAMDVRKTKARAKARFGDEFCRAVAKEVVEISDDLADRQKLLGDCIAKLKPAEKDILRRHHEEGDSIQTVATTLGRSEDAIYSALGRIRKQLFACVNRAINLGVPHAR